MSRVRFTIVVVTALAIFLLGAMTTTKPLLVMANPADLAEQMFRQTISEYQLRAQRRDASTWQVWSDLANKLLAHYNVDENEKGPPATLGSLQIIGALEESILFIERAIYEMGQPDDVMRDKALANLYYVYSKALLSLTADECKALASDPHTLLMGAETLRKEAASTHVCRENAENHLRNAATLDATHIKAATFLAELLDQQQLADGIHKRKPKEFVAELFDSFADSFDEKLVKGLAYKVPALVGQAAKKQQSKYNAVLDAGCGTGLAGRYLRPLVPTGPLIGVDASEKMLAIARECTIQTGCGADEVGKSESNDDSPDSPLYDGLLAMDLEEMTIETTLNAASSEKGGSRPQGFDLVVAADVLVYFGRLDEVLAAFGNISIPGAVLIFSCERTSNSEAPLGWRLLPSGRFAHTKEHAVHAAASAGYALQDYSEIVPRMEKGEHVNGHLFTFIMQSLGKDEL